MAPTRIAHLPFVLALVEVGAIEVAPRRYRAPLVWVGTFEPLPEQLAGAVRAALDYGWVTVPDWGRVTLTDTGRASLSPVPRQRGAIFPR